MVVAEADGPERGAAADEEPDREPLLGEHAPQPPLAQTEPEHRAGVGEREHDELDARERRQARQRHEEELAAGGGPVESPHAGPDGGDREREREGLRRQEGGPHRLRDEQRGRGQGERDARADADAPREQVDGQRHRRDRRRPDRERDAVADGRVAGEPGGRRQERREQRREVRDVPADARQAALGDRLRQRGVDVLVREERRRRLQEDGPEPDEEADADDRPQHDRGPRRDPAARARAGAGVAVRERLERHRSSCRYQSRIAPPAKRPTTPPRAEERGERDRHLPRYPAVAGEEHRARHERREHPEHQRDRDRPPEHRPEQQRELDVSHPHPGGVRERGREQERGGAEAADRPLRARVERRLGDEHERRGRQHDPVRHEPVAEVGRRERDEHEGEERCDERLRGGAPRERAAGDEAGGRELDGRVEPADPGAAGAATPAQGDVREHRHVVVPADLLAAAHAGRAASRDRAPLRHARRDDVQEAAERERRREDDRCQCEFHGLRIGTKPAPLKPEPRLSP